ncbi:MAG: Trk system potassium transporter TrkA [Clostridia bacterium]|nr:Trk system potassium transporter TrkA [Clostridia bacterium]
MNIVIIGAGKFGFKLTQILSNENHNITVIDISEHKIDRCVNYFDVLGITGNGANYDLLMEAGVCDADIVLALTESDEKNMLCSMIARKMGAKRTISRVRNSEYYDQIAFLRSELGIDMFVNPDLEAAEEISRILMLPQATQVEAFANGRIDFVELKVKEGGKLANLKVNDILRKTYAKVLICAVERDNEVYIPKGDFTLKVGDTIYISASHQNICNFIESLDEKKKYIKTVLIIGGGRITYYTAKQLLKLNMRVKIIEKNEQKCFELSEKFDKITVIHGDATDHHLLEEENIDNIDAFLALTGDDRINVILSMYAQSKNVKKIVTKVSGMMLDSLLDHIGLDTIICPKDIVSNQILSYVRANSNAKASNVQMLYRIVNEKAEVLEFHISDKDSITGKRLSEINIREDALISCISRNNKIITPSGNDIIKSGDRILVVTTSKNVMSIDDIF